MWKEGWIRFKQYEVQADIRRPQADRSISGGIDLVAAEVAPCQPDSGRSISILQGVALGAFAELLVLVRAAKAERAGRLNPRLPELLRAFFFVSHHRSKSYRRNDGLSHARYVTGQHSREIGVTAD